jgi:hypothetical protein
MAILKTQALKNYLDVFVKNRDPSNIYYECAFLNATTKTLEMQTTRWMGKINLDIELEPGEVFENFWVNVEDLARIVFIYDEFTIKGNVFSNGRDMFELHTIDEIPPSLKFESLANAPSGIVPLVLDEKTIEIISRASVFMNTEVGDALNAVFLVYRNTEAGEERHIVATNRKNLYDQITESDFNRDITLPALLVQLIMSRKALNAQIAETEEAYVLEVPDEFTLQLAIKANFELPNIYEPEFIALYDVPYSFRVNKYEIQNIIKFFDPFLATVDSSRITMTFGDDGKLCLETSDAYKIKRYLDYETDQPEFFNGREVWVNSKGFERVFAATDAKNLKIQLNADIPLFNVVSADTETPDRHISYVGMLKTGKDTK